MELAAVSMLGAAEPPLSLEASARRGKKAIVVLEDGGDNSSVSTANSAFLS